MKPIHRLMFVMIIVSLSHSAFAFENEPKGFRGIEWWTHISKLPEMKLLDDKDAIQLYVREGDRLEIGNASVQDIWYVFSKEIFAKVIIAYTSDVNHEALKRVLFGAFGEGRALSAEGWQLYWLGTRIRIIMEYDKVSSLGTVELSPKGLFFYKPEIDGSQKVQSVAPGL